MSKKLFEFAGQKIHKHLKFNMNVIQNKNAIYVPTKRELPLSLLIGGRRIWPGQGSGMHI